MAINQDHLIIFAMVTMMKIKMMITIADLVDTGGVVKTMFHFSDHILRKAILTCVPGKI